MPLEEFHYEALTTEKLKEYALDHLAPKKIVYLRTKLIKTEHWNKLIKTEH